MNTDFSHGCLQSLGALFAALVVVSCDSGRTDLEGVEGPQTTTPQDAIAYLNDTPVAAADFDAYIAHKRLKADDPESRERALDVYLEREGMARIIEEQALLADREIAAELAEFRRQMLISRYFDRYLAEQVTDEAVRNFYAANQERYSAKKARVAHVLIRTNDKMAQAEREARLTKAQEAYSRIQAQEDFAAIAAEYSEDTRSAQRGGEIGWLAEGAVDPAFSAAVFERKAGDISPPIPTPFGFHIIKVLEGPEIRVRPFDKVKGDIRYELRQQAKQAEAERLKALLDIRKAGEGTDDGA
jgi:peptidyl-prolyl cis-trans isomerase C